MTRPSLIFQPVEKMANGRDRIKRICLIILSLFLLPGCSPLAAIPYDPEITPERWLIIQPFVEVKFGSIHFILVQPSSTIFVYLLGIVAVGGGLHFLKVRAFHRSRLWWGIALLLWGFGALFAGTSYQALSYEIKCAGREICSWTSWWEIVYLWFSAASVSGMLIAGAYSGCLGRLRKVLIYYAFFIVVCYGATVLIGAAFLNEFLISFELLLIITAPTIIFLFILNSWRYYKFRDPMDFALLVTWIWLGLIIGLYFLYWSLDITDEFWDQGVWFSENDILHIGLILWMIYISVYIAKLVKDRPGPDLSNL